MTGRVYKKIEIVGTSDNSIEDAIETAVSHASKTIDHIDWFEVVETRGHVVDGSKVGHYQVVLKIGFRLKDSG